MVKVDQIAAYIPQGKYKEYTHEQWNDFKDSVFTSDKKRIEVIFEKYGFLGFDKVGKEGSNHFYLLDRVDIYRERLTKVAARQHSARKEAAVFS